jgi:hypothetical protein
MNTDITGVRFSDEARWGGGGDTKENKFKIVDERLLEKEIEDTKHTSKKSSSGRHRYCIQNLW